MTWTSAFGNACGWLLDRIVRGLALTRISPNVLTFIGLVINIAAAFLFGHANASNNDRMFLSAGLVIFGAPPVASAAQFPEAFLPNPAMNVGFTASVTEAEATAYAASFTAPGSTVPAGAFVPDILATDGAARAAAGRGVILPRDVAALTAEASEALPL